MIKIVIKIDGRTVRMKAPEKPKAMKFEDYLNYIVEMVVGVDAESGLVSYHSRLVVILDKEVYKYDSNQGWYGGWVHAISLL